MLLTLVFVYLLVTIAIGLMAAKRVSSFCWALIRR